MVTEYTAGPQMSRLDNMLAECTVNYALKGALDPDHPRIVRLLQAPGRWFGRDMPGSRWGGDNPDNAYRLAPISHDARYELHGQRMPGRRGQRDLRVGREHSNVSDACIARGPRRRDEPRRLIRHHHRCTTGGRSSQSPAIAARRQVPLHPRLPERLGSRDAQCAAHSSPRSTVARAEDTRGNGPVRCASFRR